MKGHSLKDKCTTQEVTSSHVRFIVALENLAADDEEQARKFSFLDSHALNLKRINPNLGVKKPLLLCFQESNNMLGFLLNKILQYI